MSEKSMQMLEMLEILPEQDQALVLEIMRKLVLAWDPDFTKLTAKEYAELEAAENDSENISFNDINWD